MRTLKTEKLTMARVRAGLCRNKAAEFLGVSIQVYAAAEQSGQGNYEWIARLKTLHTGVDVGPDLGPSAAEVRRLRILAGLTKVEASRCVGLRTPGGFHAYETGLSRMPLDAWHRFRAALETGSFRDFLTSAYRRGPRVNHQFVPGRRERPVRTSLGPKAANLLARTREVLRMSASDFSKLIGCTTGLVYRIEAFTSPISELHLAACLEVLRSGLASPKDEVAIRTGSDLLSWIHALRVPSHTLSRESSYARRYREDPLPPHIAKQAEASLLQIQARTARDMELLCDEIEAFLSEVK